MKAYSHVPLVSLKLHFEKWRSILNHGEIGHIFYLPHEDMIFRAYQFRDWYTEIHEEFYWLDLQEQLLEDSTSFKSCIQSIHKPIVVIARTHFYTHHDAKQILASIEAFRIETGFGVVVFHEGFPTELPIAYANSMMQHTQTLPLYDIPVMHEFIAAMMNDWHITIPKPVEDQILAYCGGNIWLVTDMLRAYRDDPLFAAEKYFYSDQFQSKMHYFWSGIPESHKEFLLYGADIALNVSAVRSELEAFGLLSAQMKPQSIPQYLQYLINQEKKQALKISQTTILYHHRDISNSFSYGEKRILYLLANVDAIVSKDDVSAAFWGVSWQEKYSEWALDKIMSRIREKILEIRLPITIKTIRGKGYEYRYTT